MNFHESLHQDFKIFINEQKKQLTEGEYIKIDLHCHDRNSDVPDELIGRILNVPETWLKTKKLVELLKIQQVDLITITNHNNARSCFDLIRKGNDILIGAEFTCRVPDFEISIHVLTYGFTEEQEIELNKLRSNVYSFLKYCKNLSIPTIWAHPFYFYSPTGVPPLNFFKKMLLIFERFEVINGQRDTWQNLLFKSWLESYSPQQLEELAAEMNVNPLDYCLQPFKKSFFAGSDSHLGLFAGTTGTYLKVDNLAQRRKTTALSQLAVEAILQGRSAVYGTHQSNEKLMIAFLDYFLQLARFKQDPGMLRLLLHKGSYQDKVLAFLASNAIAELQYHKMTMRFIKSFHYALQGKSDLAFYRFVVSKSYRKVLKESRTMAAAVQLTGDDQLAAIYNTINKVYNQLSSLFYKRVEKKLSLYRKISAFSGIDPTKFISAIDFPADIRHYSTQSKVKGAKLKNDFSLIRLLDGLPFPFLASQLILAAKFSSTKVLYNNRGLLNQFADTLQRLQHPRRILWLTDTFEDKNGVAQVLKTYHQEIKRRNLPIDFLVCSNTIESDSNLFVIKPKLEFATDYYPQQPVRIGDLMQIHDLFLKGEYDQVICSTEGFMGIAAIYLKHAFTVKASFYMHTDWLQFAQESGKFQFEQMDKFRRILREYYQQFDRVFVLNRDHHDWLSSQDIGYPTKQLFLTAHWTEDYFYPRESNKFTLFGVDEKVPVILFSGRLSTEKGVFDIVEIYNQMKNRIPSLVFAFVGTGPQEIKLKELMPDARFLGWIAHQELPVVYSSVDLLILPSRFDTFSCVVLEAMSCGIPVAAYSMKGPKEIIKTNKNGILAKDLPGMVSQITLYFNDKELKEAITENALKRAGDFKRDAILEQFLSDLDCIPEQFSPNQSLQKD
jgi:glycosyltransferase involved in cell wall biosynthesis